MGDPVVLQETNNAVFWLRPLPVIAMVGIHPDSSEFLVREHDVASALTGLGAPVGAPLPECSPGRHRATGFVVTLWQRLDHDPYAEPPGSAVGASLREVHEALSICGVRLPSFRLGLGRARAALADDSRLAALPAADGAFLRAAFEDLTARLHSRSWRDQALHGDAHDGNVLATPRGLRWIDFEAACRGPLERDLASLSSTARAAFGDVDTGLLDLLQTLNSARVATWCGVQARFPEMRRHGTHHLGIVRERWP